MPNPTDAGASSPFKSALLARFSESALAQGRNYLITGGVFNTKLNKTSAGMILEADVRRGPVRHYHVTIHYTHQGACFWQCSCPFAVQNCEHAAAVLLAWLQEPHLFGLSASDTPSAAPLPEPVEKAGVTREPDLPQSLPLPAAQQTSPSPLRIMPDLMLYLEHQQAPPALINLLTTLGVPVSVRQGQHIYQITGESLQNALEAGHPLEEIFSTLIAASGAELPAAARARLQGWADTQDNFHLYDHLSVVEFADDFVLQEMLRVGGIRRFLLHIFSPRLAAVHPRHVNDLIAEMERRGFMPKIEP